MLPSDAAFSSRDIIVLIVMLGGIVTALAKLSSIRKGLVEEVKTQLAAGANPAAVAITPNPLQVTEAVQFAPMAAHEQLSARVEGIRQELQDRFAEAARTSAESRGKIYDLIRETGSKTAALEAQISAHVSTITPRMVQLDTKVDRILERLPRKG